MISLLNRASPLSSNYHPFTPPSSKDMSSNKRQRYDRQLRLWETNGQAALEKASVCAIGSSVLMSETVKNLVLPGIGSYTIVDDSKVTSQDVANNFFARDPSSKSFRAVQVSQNLSELNRDVKSVCLVDNIHNLLLHKNRSFWDPFTLVLATGDTDNLDELSQILWDKNIPLVLVDSIGFYSSYRVFLRAHYVIDTHPDSLVDLRLDCPFPELAQYVDSIHLDQLDPHSHAHVPYIVLLLKYLTIWQSTSTNSNSNNHHLPSSKQEKDQFKELVLSNSPTPYEENYQEAVANAFRVFQPTTVPPEIRALCEESKSMVLKPTTSHFWVLVRGLSDFIDAHHALPVSGSLNDMKSDSQSFVELSKIYQEKARQDAEWVHRRALEILDSLHSHHHGDDGGHHLSFKETALFCKHSRYIKIVRGHTLQSWYANLPRLDRDDDDPMAWILLALEAARKFKQMHGSFPDGEDDCGELVNILAGLSSPNSEKGVTQAGIDICREVCRAGGQVLHNIAAFTGGITGQEIIKLVTGQYIPVNNTLVFDGISSQTRVFFI